MVELYTDGGCIGNPGPGGWAFVIKDSDFLVEAFGGEKDTTNNRMELTAVTRGLERAFQEFPGAKIKVITDSQYVKNGITTWIHSWKRNGWRTASKLPVKNQEFWVALDSVCQKMDL